MQIIDIKKQNKIALDWLLNYHKYKQEYLNKCAEISVIGAAVNDGMPKSANVGNPTANKAVSLIDLEQQKNWLLVIELAEKTLSEKSKKYLELRREAEYERQKRIIEGNNPPGRPGWVEYVQPRYAEWFYKRYGKEFVPTERAMNQWMHKIIELTVRIAIKCRVLQ